LILPGIEQDGVYFPTQTHHFDFSSPIIDPTFRSFCANSFDQQL